MKHTSLLLSAALMLACQAALFAGFVIHNEDCTQYFVEFKYSADEKGAREWMAGYLAAGPENLKIVMLNPQGQTASYDSKVLRASWRNYERREDGLYYDRGKALAETTSKMYDRMRTMSEAGDDVYRIWTDQIREAGVSPWMSVRMNDVHGAHDDQNPTCCELWKQHHEFWRATYRGGNWNARELDYAHPEVRKLYMDVIAELLERYDCDGIELDFSRFGHVFRPGHETENAHLLTDFVREVRRRCNAKALVVGHKVGVCVRVPADPADAFGSGYDVQSWIDEGLIDILAPAPFFSSSWSDLPVREWKRMVRGTTIILAPGLEAGYRPYPNFPDFTYDARQDYAAADLFYSRGADAIYCFNHFGPNAGKEYAILGDPAKTAAASRRLVTTYSDSRCMGAATAAQLPMTLTNSFSEFRFNNGTLPAAGRKVYLVLATRGKFPEDNALQMWMNGTVIKPCAVPSGIFFAKSLTDKMAFEVPADLVTPEGNVLEMHFTDKTSVSLDWLELYME